MHDWGSDGVSEKLGAGTAKGLLKSEMAKRGLTYKSLVELMAAHGMQEDERNLRNKVSRGTFTAAWFFQCMLMMEVRSLDLSHEYLSVDELLEKVKKQVRDLG